MATVGNGTQHGANVFDRGATRGIVGGDAGPSLSRAEMRICAVEFSEYRERFSAGEVGLRRGRAEASVCAVELSEYPERFSAKPCAMAGVDRRGQNGERGRH